ncbi:hypothetical protein JCM11251_007087 [Rhodosporidiobolus azoricus]
MDSSSPCLLLVVLASVLLITAQAAQQPKPRPPTMPPQLRLSYSPSIPFSLRVTFLLVLGWVLTAAGLVLFNFFTQAKQRICVARPSSVYEAATCPAAPLYFFNSYYTKPLTVDGGNVTIGTFPWQASAFGDSDNNAPIDYSILSLNWTANPLQCTMTSQLLVLHLDSQSSTTSVCYYCGANLRLLCTTVDSERTSIPEATAYQPLLQQYNVAFRQLYALSTTAFPNTTISSLRLVRQIAPEGLPTSVLKVNETTSRPNDTNPALGEVATTALALGDYIEMTTSRDLQPDAGDTTSQQRTLLVNYLCRDCMKVYKPKREIVAILLSATTAVLSTLFMIYRLIAEWLVTRNQPALPASAAGSTMHQYQPAGSLPSPPLKASSSYRDLQVDPKTSTSHLAYQNV